MYTLLIVGFLIMLAGIIAVEIGISAAVLEIIMGLLAANILDITNYDEYVALTVLANLGLLTIMFLAGFELNMEYLKGRTLPILSVAISSFMTPFILLFVSIFILLPVVLLGAFHATIGAALIIATALSTTSIALVYPLLKNLGYLKNEIGNIMVATAAMVDIVSMIAISVIFNHSGLLMLIVIPFLLIGFKGFPILTKLLFSRYKGNVTELELKIILFIILGISAFAEQIDVESAVIVFFLGLVLSKVIKDYKELEPKLNGLTFGFLAPVFFFIAGTRIRLDLITPLTIVLALIFLAVSLVGKYYGTCLPSCLFMKRKYARMMSVSFMYKLSFSIIVAMFGLDMGIIDNSMYTAIMIVVLVTAIIPSAMLRNVPREIDVDGFLEKRWAWGAKPSAPVPSGEDDLSPNGD